MFINIEVERLRHYMSKRDMAATLNVPIKAINDWVCKREPIPADKLRALSRLFDCSLDYLLKERR